MIQRRLLAAFAALAIPLAGWAQGTYPERPMQVCVVKELDEIDRKVEREIEEAVAFAQNSPDPRPEEAFEDVYVGEYIP